MPSLPQASPPEPWSVPLQEPSKVLAWWPEQSSSWESLLELPQESWSMRQPAQLQLPQEPRPSWPVRQLEWLQEGWPAAWNHPRERLLKNPRS